ncbi:uncharacterized protein LOC118417496 isoform X3 [Branchiostoma floridae]|uniref:Uncharacterized protein LOC118417496 isoform X3 n=1 Tax=Branchiostoma floridae TaxID=7739 RepID=A0A9J7LCA4_BRAFL|nr:uncharacterized protein LOC118417496 isoform X3 [Branchiostoma floridae]
MMADTRRKMPSPLVIEECPEEDDHRGRRRQNHIAEEFGIEMNNTGHSRRRRYSIEEEEDCSEDGDTPFRIRDFFHVGEVSNLICLVAMIIGITLVEVFKNDTRVPKHAMNFLQVFRAMGLFSVSGGVTNWLAVKMLFDRIPGLIGSGVITSQFKEIRQTVKNVVLETFFETEYLENYMHRKSGEFLAAFQIESKLQRLLQSERVMQIIDNQVQKLYKKPEGMMLAMMGVDAGKLSKMIQPLMKGLSRDMTPVLAKNLKTFEFMNAESMRAQVDEMMTVKMEEFTPPKVKKLVEQMIRQHLGWLVVWGNVFGALLGTIAEVVAIFT